MTAEMRVLTVRQPWALHIIQSGKDVENRPRNIAGKYRGPVAIHAGLRADEDALRRLPQKAPNGIPRIFRYGQIIGVVDLIAVHGKWTHDVVQAAGMPEGFVEHETCSLWAEPDSVHLVLTNPRRLRNPIPFRGALGLRRLDADTIDRINREIA